MKKLIAFIILVILVILVICLSYNYYKKQDTKRINKLKTDLQTSEVLKDKSISKSNNDTDNDRIEVEEQDTNKTNKNSDESDDNDGVTEEETNLNVPDTASDDNSGFIKLDYYTVSSKDSIKVGKTTQIKVKYYPENASVKDTMFISENKNCKVSSLGKVTGLKKGTCSILVKVKDQSTKSLLLTVK